MAATSDDIVNVALYWIIKGKPWSETLEKVASLLNDGHRREDIVWRFM